MTAIGRTRRSFLRSSLLTAAAALGIAGPVAAGMRAGDRPKTVTLADLAGAKVALPDAYAGKVVVVHFWATWCPYCIKEIDALEALFGQYRERGLVPVSVNVGESMAVAAEFVRTRTVTYPILLDTDSAAAKLYGVTGLPTTFVLDRAGAIAFKILGEINRDGLRRILSGTLGA
jgi:cytochrome c biogenesis protein CcmG/thiol:disulfide interchange protein DsbE